MKIDDCFIVFKTCAYILVASKKGAYCGQGLLFGYGKQNRRTKKVGKGVGGRDADLIGNNLFSCKALSHCV